MLTASGILCIASAVTAEARGEPLVAQYGVIHTIRNRVRRKGYPNHPCKVVRQPSQYKRLRPKDSAKAKQLVLKAWAAPDVTGGATHFHDISVRPKWAAKMVRTRKYSRLCFYKEKLPKV